MLTHAMNHSGQPRGYPWMRILAMLFCAAVLGACGNSTNDLIRSAEEFRGKGDHAAGIVQLKNALGQEPNHLEGSILIGLSYAETGDAVDAERKLRRAVELGAPHARVLPTLGQVLIETEQYQQAIDELRKAKDVNGETVAQIALLIGRAQTELKQYAEARTQYLLAGTSKPSDAKLGLARISAAEGDRKAAYKLTDEVLADEPQNIEAWLAKGDLLRGDAKNTEALKAYQQASTLAPTNVSARVSQAFAYMNLGKNTEARAELALAKKRAPANAALRFALASLALRERKFEECTENLAAVLRIIPRHMPSLLLKGAMHFASNQLQQAELAFSAYLNLQPGHIYARKMLAAVLLRKDQAQSAVYLLEPMIPLVEGDAELMALAGEAYMQLGQTLKAKEYLARSVALDPENAANFVKLGVARIKTGETQKGYAELESAIALNPGESRADHTLIMTLLAQNEPDKAMRAVQALEKRRPDKADTHYLKASVYRAMRDIVAARDSFEQTLRLEPKSFAATASLAQLDVQEKQPDAARVRMESLLKLDPRNLDAMLLLSVIEIDAGRQKEGIGWLRKAVGDHPNMMLPYAVLADALLKGGEPADALGSAQRARELSPKDHRVVALLADIQMAMGNKEAALTTYAAAAQLQPASVPLQVKLAEAFARNGNVREANNVVRRLVEAFPHDLQAKAALAENLMLRRNFTEALDIARQIQKQAAALSLGYLLEGEIGMGQQDYARATAALEKADTLEANGLARIRLHQARTLLSKGAVPVTGLEEWVKLHPNDMRARFYLAEIHGKAGSNKAAIEHYHAILRLNPRHLPTLNNLALALHHEGDPKAVDYATQAFQIKPDDARLADTAGWILVSQGKLREGLPVLSKAASLDSENPEIRFHLAQALLKAGNTARARSELKIALASKHVFPQLEEARALFKSLGE